MSSTVQLIGAEEITRAAQQMRSAAEQMQQVATQIEDTMARRRQWEEEYLARIEALVQRELDFYSEKPR